MEAIDRAGRFIETPALPSLRLSSAFPAGWIPDLGRRALEPGGSLGPYTIREFVGAGGMGEVYRAHDTNLNRDVALKVRPVAFALDADRFTRFRREAQTLAALNHPNIAAIYGFEHSDGVQALVLEFVDGLTLERRIEKGRIPWGEALSIARQIAVGLEAAHKRGIIHSDLKPANIKLRPDGSVKILDFGLARALDALDTGTAPTDNAGLDGSFSHAGPIFGTPAYMSPEQARGEAVDRRTDIWGFGCVLYETLAGQSAFGGTDIESILAAVMNDDPDWNALPGDTPADIKRLLRRCLEKNVDRRLHDIADARIEIEDAAAPAIPTRSPKPRRWPLVALTGVTVAALLFAAWTWPRGTNSAPRANANVIRSQIRLPQSGPLASAASLPLGLAQLSLAMAPGGTHVVYVLEREGVTQLYLHPLDQWEPTAIPGTEGAFGPFFSPDGNWIGFFDDNKLKKVSVSGGEPIDLSDAPNPYGGSWGTNGRILFSPDEGRRPMWVSETGGTPEQIVIKNNQGSWRRPEILPGGKSAIVSNPMLGVAVLSLETGEYRVLVQGAGGGRYVPGFLVFARPGLLLAAPFDLERLELTGPEVAVLEDVRTASEGDTAQPQATFSPNGTLVYAAGGAPKNLTRPVWVDRRGNVQPLAMPPRTYRTMRLSPDERFLAIIIADPRNDLWVHDLQRGTLTRRTSGLQPDRVNWTPDGERLVVGSRRGGMRRGFWMPRDGSSEPQPVKGQPGIGSYSPDGQRVATGRGDPDNPQNGLDLWIVDPNGEQPAQPYLRTRFTEVGPEFSPDGRFIAYVSDESGQYEVYVRPYPVRDGKWQVSTNGGEEAKWSSDGKELFYRNGRQWMVAAVKLKPDFESEIPKLLFEGPYANVGGASYNVSRDGRRLLLLEPVEPDLAPVTHLNVILNWFEHIRQKAGSAPAQTSR
jgi:serine/threonine protein kinase/Tol biopolymer transport system component